MTKKTTKTLKESIQELTQKSQTPVVVDKTPLAVNAAKTQPKPRGKGKPFPPGVSGNPAGAKPGYHWGKTYLLKIIKETAKTTDGKTMELGEAMARAQVQMAIKGDTRAFNAVFDRIDGKAPQPHIGDDGEDPIRVDLGIARMLEKGYGNKPKRTS